jgi:hypothetical protein
MGNYLQLVPSVKLISTADSANANSNFYNEIPSSGTQLPLSTFTPIDPEREFIRRAITGTIEGYDELVEEMKRVQGVSFHISIWNRALDEWGFPKFKNIMRTLVHQSNKRDYIHENTIRRRYHQNNKYLSGRKNKVFYQCIAFAPKRSWMNGTPRK